MLKITVDDGVAQRLFIPEGSFVTYERVDSAVSSPRLPGQPWDRKGTTRHILTWESVSYE